MFPFYNSEIMPLLRTPLAQSKRQGLPRNSSTLRWNISINGRKSQHCNFTLRGKIVPRVELLDTHAQYLGLILDKRLTWKQHTTKIAATWLLKPTSKLSLGNKVLLFKTIVVPSMTYCIQLWGMASDSNVMKVQRVQNRALRMIAALTSDLHVPSVREQINRHSSRYNDRLNAHINHLAASLAHPRTRRRLKRRHPSLDKRTSDLSSPNSIKLFLFNYCKYC